ncbi:MAG TPA: tol-pal system protein YbgF [Geminicoccaceae bacterium]|nr:tol-pal system protein YbgF [Geminicoccus sp.]HMU50378.1 tol-pal system protein YbgF [Geminicoccaceae bacterium]
MLRTALPTLLALGFLSVPAGADTPAALRAGVDALAAETAQLRGVQLAQADAGQLANITVRLSRMEEELRRLTGRLEQLEYGRDQAQDRLDKLVADMDLRLGRIEAGGTAGQRTEPPVVQGAAEPEPEQLSAPEPRAAVVAPAPAPAPASTPRAATRAAPSPQDDTAARRGYVLGTLPRDAIMGDGTAAAGTAAGAGTAPRAVTAEPQRQAALTRPDTPKGRYDAALALLQSGDFGSAQDEFADFLSDYPKDPLAPSAAYWLAETHYVQRDFAGAASQFAKNFQTYGDSATKAPDNLLKMAMSLSQLGQKTEACRVFDELTSRFPNAAPPIKQAAARGRAGAGCG